MAARKLLNHGDYESARQSGAMRALLYPGRNEAAIACSERVAGGQSRGVSSGSQSERRAGSGPVRNVSLTRRSQGLRMLPRKGTTMLYYALVFLIVAIIAGILGFGAVAFAAAGIAKILFFIFLVLFIISLVAHLGRGHRV